MQTTTLVDIVGRRRSPATLPGTTRVVRRATRACGIPADPPAVEEIITVMPIAGDNAGGVRLRGLIVVLWRAGLRISEALALAESDLDAGRGAILVRHGKGGKRREVGMDRWGWEQLTARSVAQAALHPSGRRVVMHPARSDARTAVGPGRRPHPTARRSCSRWGATAVHAASLSRLDR